MQRLIDFAPELTKLITPHANVGHLADHSTHHMCAISFSLFAFVSHSISFPFASGMNIS